MTTKVWAKGEFEQDGFKVEWVTYGTGDTYLRITAPNDKVLKMGANDTGAWSGKESFHWPTKSR